MNTPKQQAVNSIQEHFAVMRVDEHFRLVATRNIAPGEVILVLGGRVVSQPSRFSVQIGADEHLDIPEDVGNEETLDRYRWRFLNHGCEPNAVFRGRGLIALRPIAAWEQICFDYNTTEYDLDHPFECHCGSDRCCGVIRGFRWLTPEQRADRADAAALHLFRSFEREVACQGER